MLHVLMDKKQRKVTHSCHIISGTRAIKSPALIHIGLDGPDIADS